MTIPVVPADSPEVAPAGQLHRRNRLMAILEKGLPPFKHTVVELMSVLNDPSADFKKAAKPIYTDPALSAQVLRMCNSPLFGRRSRVISIEQAVAMLGVNRLRSIAMTSSLVGFAGQGLPKEQVASFWEHNFLAAMLSKYLAQYMGYTEVEQAYIAGLLHDVGQVPQWMLAAEENNLRRTETVKDWLDYPSAERSYFGMDHSDLGSRMAKTWTLMPSFIDVILNHHEPAEAQHDPYLVKIVGAVEHFLLAKQETVLLSSDGEPSSAELQLSEDPLVNERSHQPFADADWPAIAENLENEYIRLLPLVEKNLVGMIGSAS